MGGWENLHANIPTSGPSSLSGQRKYASDRALVVGADHYGQYRALHFYLLGKIWRPRQVLGQQIDAGSVLGAGPGRRALRHNYASHGAAMHDITP